jgi:aspartate/glutamate racemase
LNEAAYANFVSLRKEVENYIVNEELSKVLVLATSTSAKKSLYNFEGAICPPLQEQQILDCIIQRVLSGDMSLEIKIELTELISNLLKQDPKINGVLLGCSEFSVLVDGYLTDILEIKRNKKSTFL